MRLGLVSALAGALLAACGTPTVGLSPSQAPQTASRSSTLFQPPSISALPQTRRSWVSPQAKTLELLYLSDPVAGDVSIYSWPYLHQLGIITGFKGPAGLCSDKSGNVYVTDSGKANVIEYAHGSVTQSKTLGDPGEVPSSCAVDPKSGNLAVGNVETTGSGPGSIALYKGAAGKPTLYSTPELNRLGSVTYDPQGNLFAFGANASNVFELYKFSPSHVFSQITISGATIHVVGGTTYGDGSLTIADSDGASGYGVIYKISETGTVEGSTPLKSVTDGLLYIIVKTKVIIADDLAKNYQIYFYPSGGSPTRTINNFKSAYGETLSH